MILKFADEVSLSALIEYVKSIEVALQRILLISNVKQCIHMNVPIYQNFLLLSVPCAPDTTSCAVELELVADRTYCTNFFICQSGQWVEQQCPPSDPYFDASSIACTNNPSVCSACDVTLPYVSTTTETIITEQTTAEPANPEH